MEYLPLFFNVRGRACAIVGGNATAARKAELLLRAGARARVIAAELGELLTEHARVGRLEHAPKPLGPDSFADCVLAVVALEDETRAADAAALASSQNIPVNVVDRQELCSCIMPAIVDRSPILVSISTAGAAPVPGRLLRARLEALLPARLCELAQIARELRRRRTFVAGGAASGRRNRGLRVDLIGGSTARRQRPPEPGFLKNSGVNGICLLKARVPRAATFRQRRPARAPRPAPDPCSTSVRWRFAGSARPSPCGFSLGCTSSEDGVVPLVKVLLLAPMLLPPPVVSRSIAANRR